LSQTGANTLYKKTAGTNLGQPARFQTTVISKHNELCFFARVLRGSFNERRYKALAKAVAAWLCCRRVR